MTYVTVSSYWGTLGVRTHCHRPTDERRFSFSQSDYQKFATVHVACGVRQRDPSREERWTLVWKYKTTVYSSLLFLRDA